MGTLNLTVNRHCGLDPQSPTWEGFVFPHWRWQILVRHDGKRHKIDLSCVESLYVN
jgi:hypothetical protein